MDTFTDMIREIPRDSLMDTHYDAMMLCKAGVQFSSQRTFFQNADEIVTIIREDGKEKGYENEMHYLFTLLEGYPDAETEVQGYMWLAASIIAKQLLDNE